MITPDSLRAKIVSWIDDPESNLSSALDVAVETNSSILIIEGNEKLVAFVHPDRDILLTKILKKENVAEMLAMVDAMDSDPESDRLLVMYFNEETTYFGNVFMKKWPVED